MFSPLNSSLKSGYSCQERFLSTLWMLYKKWSTGGIFRMVHQVLHMMISKGCSIYSSASLE